MQCNKRHALTRRPTFAHAPAGASTVHAWSPPQPTYSRDRALHVAVVRRNDHAMRTTLARPSQPTYARAGKTPRLLRTSRSHRPSFRCRPSPRSRSPRLTALVRSERWAARAVPDAHAQPQPTHTTCVPGSLLSPWARPSRRILASTVCLLGHVAEVRRVVVEFRAI